MKSIILASNSPRRKELLQLITPNFEIIPANVDESYSSELTPNEVAAYLAQIKAKAVAEHNSQSIVIGCDTVVVINNEILGKPNSSHDAFRMLKLLSGNTHEVITGVCLSYDNSYETFTSRTKVTFQSMTETEINDYIDTNDPFDKAGAYGIQGQASKFIHSIQGDFYTVVGLPVHELYQRLKQYMT